MTGYPHADSGRKRTVPTLPILVVVGLLATLGFAYQAGFLGRTASPAAEPPTEIVVSSQRLDFGTIPPNGSATRQLVVRNEGADAVEATLVADESYNVEPDRLILHPGISSRISVAVNASREGRFNDKLRIRIDDPNRSTLLIGLAGRVAAEEPATTTPVAGPAPERLRASSVEGPTETAGRPASPRSGRAGASTRSLATTTTTTTVTPKTGARVADSRSGSAKSTQPTPPARKGGGVDATSRRRTANDAASRERERTDSEARERGSRSIGITVRPYDPETAVPFTDLTESAPPAPEQISEDEAERAGRIPSKIPGGNENELPDRLPEEEERERMFDDDIFDDSDELEANENPITSPALKISGLSSVRLLGSSATFYPQEIPIVGQNVGGPLNLIEHLEFPVVPLAFGESMLFAPTSGAVGSFDSLTGDVHLELGVQAVDSDGDAAPLLFTMTTGTTYARNEAGVVVSISGTPRAADSGMLRLVGIQKIPVGYRNGAEQHLVVVEILAALDFGTTISPQRPPRMGRLGG